MSSLIKNALVALLIISAIGVSYNTIKAQNTYLIYGTNAAGNAVPITTDASGNLNMKIAGGGGTFTSQILAANGTAGAPSYSFTNNTNAGMWDNAGVITIQGAGTGTLQIGSSSGSDDIQFFTRGSNVINISNGDLVPTATRNMGSSTGGNVWSYWSAAQAQSYHIGTGGTARSTMGATGDGLLQIENSAGTFGIEVNTGTAAPTITTCGTGTVTTGSRNSAGEVTATGATACTVNFGAPNFTNTPFCIIEDETSAVAQRISAISASSFTVTGLTSGDKFMWICFGRI